MYECFHCGQKTVGWDCDYSFEDMGIIMDDCEDGIVHICHCSNCGAEIEYRVPIYSEEPEEDNKVPDGQTTIDEYL